MIKKLQKRFILLATLSLFLLLFLVVLSSSVLSYHSLVSEEDRILQVLADNAGHFPKMDREKKENENEDVAIVKKPDQGKRKMDWSPEIFHESRFFTIFTTDNGETARLNMDNIAAVDEKEALSMAGQVRQSGKERGFYGNYRYLKSDNGSGTMVIFLDCGRKLDSFWNMIWIHGMISILSLMVVFVILAVASGKIVKPVAQAYDKQKQFVSVAGHELKTPLTIIDADSELLRLDVGEENEWLEDICTQTKRMANLTNDLLKLCKMDEWKQDTLKIEFPLSDLFMETVKSFQVLADKEHVRFQVSAEPMLSYTGDEKLIQQLIGILLDNAVKYAAKEEPVLIELKRRKQCFSLMVENSVEYTISQEQCQCFFDRFYRTEQSERSEKGGYGLGLAIAKVIVEAHNGKITADAVNKKRVRIRVLL